MASVISKFNDLPYGSVPDRAGLSNSAGVETRRVIDGGDRPLLLWMHRLKPGATLAWNRPAQDHLAYVWEGAVEAEGRTLGADEVFIVEHGGHGGLKGGPAGAVVLHFHRPEDFPEPPSRAGGHAHVVAGADIRRGVDTRRVGRALYADSACPTCEVWLHGNQLPEGQRVDRHYHTEDEIVVVTEGEILMGRLAYGRGSVLAIDAETQYAFTCGEGGLSFINYRPASPVYVIGDNSKPPADERELLLKGLANSIPA